MYGIEWKGEAYDDLARIWMAADAGTRAAINPAVEELERRLSADPMVVGESREVLTRRVVHQWPIGMDVNVDPLRHVVQVFRVWRY